MPQAQLSPLLHTAVQYVQQAEKLSLEAPRDGSTGKDSGVAVSAKFITPLDPVIETASGNRLPAIPVYEAHKLNVLKDGVEAGSTGKDMPVKPHPETLSDETPDSTDRQLESVMPPWRTHPLFPPLPLYGPPSLMRDVHCTVFKITSFFLSTAFLAVIVLGSLFTSVPRFCQYFWLWLTFRDPNSRRPFYAEEQRRREVRKGQESAWLEKQRKKHQQRKQSPSSDHMPESGSQPKRYEPLEGGPDP